MPVQVANPDAQKAVELLFKADAHPLGHGHLKVLTSTMESLLAALAGPSQRTTMSSALAGLAMSLRGS